jgi:hypothetical protein
MVFYCVPNHQLSSKTENLSADFPPEPLRLKGGISLLASGMSPENFCLSKSYFYQTHFGAWASFRTVARAD